MLISDNLRGCFVFSSLLVVFLMLGCNSRRDPNLRTYESSYGSNSTATATKTPIEESPYYHNSLSTGISPYLSNATSFDDESQISVMTSSSSNCDVVVIVKRGGEIARNAYIKAGGSYTFNIPNGTYQVFFYGGKGWNPNKEMPNGMKGGFVANESYSKDSPVSLEYQGLTYELILQPNGNFSTQQSNANEIF